MQKMLQKLSKFDKKLNYFIITSAASARRVPSTALQLRVYNLLCCWGVVVVGMEPLIKVCTILTSS
jgi:hypothetical protein